jgi:hypothetical protein
LELGLARLCPPSRLLLPLASSVLTLLRPDHLCERLKSLRRLDPSARERRQDSAEQAGAVSDDADRTDRDDEPQQIETQALRNIEDYTLFGR